MSATSSTPRTRLPRTSRRRARVLLRALHVTIGALLATLVYLPVTAPGHDVLHAFLAFAGVPLVTASGLALAKQAAISRLLTRRR